MAQREQEIEQLQVLLLLGQVPFAKAVSRQAPHALCLHWQAKKSAAVFLRQLRAFMKDSLGSHQCASSVRQTHSYCLPCILQSSWPQSGWLLTTHVNDAGVGQNSRQPDESL